MVRKFIANSLSKAGSGIFSLLSRWEEKGVLPKTARWVKLTALGALAVAITAFCRKVETEPRVMCYRAAPVPDVVISDITITPNPTGGADSVTVRGTAKIQEMDIDNNYISAAQLWIGGDTIPYDMQAVDGKFADTLEVLIGSLPVGDLAASTTWVDISITTSLNGLGCQGSPLVVTDNDGPK